MKNIGKFIGAVFCLVVVIVYAIFYKIGVKVR